MLESDNAVAELLMVDLLVDLLQMPANLQVKCKREEVEHLFSSLSSFVVGCMHSET